MRRITALLGVTAVATAVAATTSGAAAASSTVRVTNANDTGSGSLRAAVALANADPSVRKIELRPGLAPIGLATPVEVTGAQALQIVGNGGTLDGSALDGAADAALLVTGGGDLTVRTLTVQGTPQEGIEVRVPSGATGTTKIVLGAVQILGNRGHGVLVRDQANPDVTEPPDPAGSDAGLDVTVTGSRFSGNGFGALDRDGLRVDEGAGGSLRFSVTGSRFEGNGADGVELDERGDGGVAFDVDKTEITGNGAYDVTLEDLDDGMDVDESGVGSIVGRVTASRVSDNLEEGLDLNENDAGDLRVELSNVEASRNGEEGVDLEEDDDYAGGGDLTATLARVTADGNKGGDAGIKIREKGDGNLSSTVRSAHASDNDTRGIQLREDGNGDLADLVERSTTSGNASHGIDLDENDDGLLTATARRGTSSTNGGAGVRADQGGTGSGALQVTGMALDGNVGGAVVSNVPVG